MASMLPFGLIKSGPSFSEPGSLTIGVPTDGSAAHVRALLDEVDPDRRAVQRFAVHSATLDDVFLALTGRPADRAEPASLAV